MDSSNKNTQICVKRNIRWSFEGCSKTFEAINWHSFMHYYIIIYIHTINMNIKCVLAWGALGLYDINILCYWLLHRSVLQYSYCILHDSKESYLWHIKLLCNTTILVTILPQRRLLIGKITLIYVVQHDDIIVLCINITTYIAVHFDIANSKKLHYQLLCINFGINWNTAQF